MALDADVAAAAAARRSFTDRLVRVAKLRRILNPAVGHLIAVRLSILTRRTLGGVETDLDARMMQQSGDPLPGVYAEGRAAAAAVR